MKWNVRLSIPAENQWLGIKDSRIREQIRRRIRSLEDNPEQQGKPLGEELYGYRSVKAVGQRYRVIYKLNDIEVLVLVVMVGIRKDGDKKDVYMLAKKLARLGLLDLISFPESESDNKPETTEA
jgi:mRNA interferase RelE/StbE